VFVIKTRIGAPADHKENIHKNESCRRKKVGGKRQQDLVRRKESYQSSVKPFYLKRWSNWMNDLIKKERCDQYELTMMVSLLCYLLAGVLLLSLLMVIGTVSTVSFPAGPLKNAVE
jgi:hypothetical protein